MSSSSLIAEYLRTKSHDARYEILQQISDVSDEVGLSFLLEIIRDESGDDGDRLGAVEAVKAHSLTIQSDMVFNLLMGWLEITKADQELQSHVALVIPFCGFDKSNKRDRVLKYLNVEIRCDLVADCFLTQIGIYGRGKFKISEIAALKSDSLNELIEFVFREWERQAK